MGAYDSYDVRRKSDAGVLHIGRREGIDALCGRIVAGYEYPPYRDSTTNEMRRRTVADVIATGNEYAICKRCRERAGI